MMEDRPSAQRMNRYGDKGFPSLNPLEGLIYPSIYSLILTEQETVDMHSNIKLIHLLGEPRACNIFSTKGHSILS